MVGMSIRLYAQLLWRVVMLVVYLPFYTIFSSIKEDWR